MLASIFKVFIARKEFFLELFLEHIQISIISITLAMVIGLVIGFVISEFKKSTKVVLGIVNSVYTIPSISLLGFLIPITGIGNKTAIIALTIYALLPMVRNTHAGLTNINPLLVEAAIGMGSTKMQVLLKIKLPLAMPIIIAGVRNMAVMTIALAGIASFIGAGGLGVAIYRGITTNNKAMTIIGSLLIATLAIIIDLLIGLFENKIKKHRV